MKKRFIVKKLARSRKARTSFRRPKVDTVMRWCVVERGSQFVECWGSKREAKVVAAARNRSVRRRSGEDFEP